MTASAPVPAQSRAQSLTEFALALPAFLLVLLAFFNLGALLFTYISLANATREMARELSITSASATSTAMTDFNNTLLIDGPLSSPSLTVSVYNSSGTLEGTSNGAGCTIPITTGTCTIPTRTTYDLGYVDVVVSATYTFVPTFQAPFGVNSTILPSPTLTTTAKAYIE